METGTLSSALPGASALPVLLTVGIMSMVAFYAGRVARRIRLPSIIGYMIVGLLFGPSGLGMVTDELLGNLSFITELALGFVALSIGLELSLSSLRALGRGIVVVIFAESFAAFIVAGAGVYLLTGDLMLGLVFGSLAPASAPAGTVAVIRENNASGTLTKALYAVVGFDDGLAIVIFGFAFAAVRLMLTSVAGAEPVGIWDMVSQPLWEILVSIVLGWLLAVAAGLVCRRFEKAHNVLILLTILVLITNGLCTLLHLSLMLTNMTVGLVAVNRGRRDLPERLQGQLATVMPLFFLLFFSLAGAQLHVDALPALGALGVVYILGRSIGLMGGAWLGARAGDLEEKVKRYLGLGILSQAGVAIGLALIVKQECQGLGPVIEFGGQLLPRGDALGAMVITTVTATSIVFEVIGPILTRYALSRAGEIGAGSSTR